MDQEERRRLAMIGRGEIPEDEEEKLPEKKKNPISAYFGDILKNRRKRNRFLKRILAAAVFLILLFLFLTGLKTCIGFVGKLGQGSKTPETVAVEKEDGPPNTGAETDVSDSVDVNSGTSPAPSDHAQSVNPAAEETPGAGEGIPVIAGETITAAAAPAETAAEVGTSQQQEIHTVTVNTTVNTPVKPWEFVIPEWIEQDLIPVNPYSRPQLEMQPLQYISIHYVANPGSTARGNREYFQNLGDPNDPAYAIRKAGAHFVVGLEGEIIQCIPVYEGTYGMDKEHNYNTIHIECCHPDETGKFTETTIESLCKLASWLMQQYHLDSTHLIRHYDGTVGKPCPLYYVEHPDEWEALKQRIQNYCDSHPGIS